MPSLLSKFFISAALASGVVFTIPAKSIYTRVEDVASTTIMAEITSYSSEPDQTDATPDITASGTHVHDGTIACPYAYAFGTLVVVDGKTYTCEDRMSSKFPARFDIWSASTAEAVAWGIKRASVSILQ